jgi:hypothetical protein
MEESKKIITLAIAISLILSAVILFLPGQEVAEATGNPPSDPEDSVPTGPELWTPNQGEIGCPLPVPCEPRGTTLSVTKSAVGFWECRIVYDWEVEKDIDDPETDEEIERCISIDRGESFVFEFEIETDRFVAEECEVFGVRGSICVENCGDEATDGLRIEDVVQVRTDGEWVDLVCSKVDTCMKPVLQPCESHSYPYYVEFCPAKGEYRNIARVTICNWEDHIDERWGTETCVEFDLPDRPNVIEVDERAKVKDSMTCPEGFVCEASDIGPWVITDPSPHEDIVYYVTVTNVDAECGQKFELGNEVCLIELDTCCVRTDETCVCIETPPCECFTTISVEKDATLEWDFTAYYDWEVTKTVESADPRLQEVSNGLLYELDTGESAYLMYTVESCYGLTGVMVDFTVHGDITVCNEGNCPTQGLYISDVLTVRIGGEFYDDYQLNVDVSDKPILQGGECYDYPYEFTDSVFFTLEEIKIYTEEEEVNSETLEEFASLFSFTDEAEACIINYEGYFGQEHCVYATFGPEVPVPDIWYYDECADITDVQDCPEGFSCEITSGSSGPWEHTVGTNLEWGCYQDVYVKTVTNVEAECDGTFYVTNNVTLVECDSLDEHYAETSVQIDTPPCECGGCTLTIGYWKNHDGSGPQSDEITPLIQLAGGTIWLGDEGGAESIAVTTAAQASAILAQDEADNGINKLYAQMLAAKLNILNGACDDAVDETIAEADAFLATHGSDDWEGLTAEEQQQVLDWKDVFDDYNNGIIGPGHCSDEE